MTGPLIATELRVRSMSWEADGVIALDLVAADQSLLPQWSAGAHVDLLLPNGLERQFSLCSDPADRHRYRLGILREPNSRGATQYIHEQLRPGALVRVNGPRNNFEVLPADEYLFIAGGIGITPLLAMLRVVEGSGRPWRLLYGGRRRAGMAFLDELSRYGDHVVVFPEDERGKLPLSEWITENTPGGDVYCCGPEPLLDAVEQRCALVGRPDGALHVERFHPRPQPLGTPDANRPFDVFCARSGITVTVAPDLSILGALEAAGVDIPSSCQEGICGTCETVVIDGKPDHRDSLLTAAERAEGRTMMVCCSRALGPRLVLDV